MSSKSVKMEDSSSVKPEKKKTGRPRKNPMISYQPSQSESFNSIKQNYSSTRSIKKSVVKQPKMQQQEKVSVKQKSIQEVELKPLKPLEPNEKQLCQALLIIKSKLPNRSLERIIIKLHQVFQGQNLIINAPSIQQNNSVVENLSVIQPYKYNQNQHKNSEKILSVVSQGQEPIKQQQIKQSQPQNWQKISQMVSGKKVPKIEQQIEVSEQYQNGKNVIFNFKSASVKKVIYNPQEENKYNERRKIARIFIERGFAVTKKIDRQLPQIDIQRNHFRNLMGGVLTHAFRTLQSFLVNKCQRTITILDQSQMKSLIFVLLHCRFRLEPDNSDTFLRFLTIAYALNDATVTQNQAVALYIDAMKYLFGKNITMEICENKGRIRNMRENKKVQVPNASQVMQRPMKIFKVKKDMNKSIYNQTEPECKDEQLWTLKLQQQFARLYINLRKIVKTKEQMVNRHTQFQFLSIQSFEAKLNELLIKGFRRIQQDCKKMGISDPFAKSSQKEVIQLQKGHEIGQQIKSFILAYLFSNQQS